jgi:hypothetical protein
MSRNAKDLAPFGIGLRVALIGRLEVRSQAPVLPFVGAPYSCHTMEGN